MANNVVKRFSIPASGKSLLRLFFGGILSLVFMPGTWGVELDDSLEVVSKTHSRAVQSQQKIDQLSRETDKLLEEYRKLRDGADYQAGYTRELEDLVRSQQQKIEDLQWQIAQAQITRQRIVPLMRSMAQALEKFVVLDLPFHHDQRIASVLQLQRRLQQPDLSLSSRFRLLLEAFQLEQQYGDTLETWRGPLNISGRELSVEFFRVGRVALYYQTLDGTSSRYWNTQAQEWLVLDPKYQRALTTAFRVAGKQLAPQLLQLPMLAPGAEL